MNGNEDQRSQQIPQEVIKNKNDMDDDDDEYEEEQQEEQQEKTGQKDDEYDPMMKKVKKVKVRLLLLNLRTVTTPGRKKCPCSQVLWTCTSKMLLL